MTWRQLLAILQNMEKVGHTAIDDPVQVCISEEFFHLDLVESLTQGNVYLVTESIEVNEEEEDGTEA